MGECLHVLALNEDKFLFFKCLLFKNECALQNLHKGSFPISSSFLFSWKMQTVTLLKTKFTQSK